MIPMTIRRLLAVAALALTVVFVVALVSFAAASAQRRATQHGPIQQAPRLAPVAGHQLEIISATRIMYSRSVGERQYWRDPSTPASRALAFFWRSRHCGASKSYRSET